MSFAWPMALLGLGLVALAVVAYAVAQRRRRRYVVRFTNLALLENVVADSPRWRRHIPATLALLALTALVIGIARPQVAVAVARGGHGDPPWTARGRCWRRTWPRPNDSGARAASSFVKDLPDDFRVGVVSFSDQADIVVPPTDDRAEALRGLALVADNGTALGDAIARSVDLGVTSLDQELAAANADDTPSSCSSSQGEHDRRLRAARGGAEGGRREGAGVHGRARGRGHGAGPDGYGGMRTIRVPPTPRRCHRWPR